MFNLFFYIFQISILLLQIFFDICIIFAILSLLPLSQKPKQNPSERAQLYNNQKILHCMQHQPKKKIRVPLPINQCQSSCTALPLPLPSAYQGTLTEENTNFLRKEVTRLIRNKIQPLAFKHYVLKMGSGEFAGSGGNLASTRLQQTIDQVNNKQNSVLSIKRQNKNSLYQQNQKSDRKKLESKQSKHRVNSSTKKTPCSSPCTNSHSHSRSNSNSKHKSKSKSKYKSKAHRVDSIHQQNSPKRKNSRRQALVRLNQSVEFNAKNYKQLQKKVQQHIILKRMDILEDQYAYAEECNQSDKRRICHKINVSPLSRFINMFQKGQLPSQKIKRIQQKSCQQLLKQIKSSKSIKHIQFMEQNVKDLWNADKKSFSQKEKQKQNHRIHLPNSQARACVRNRKLKEQIITDIRKEYQNQGSSKIRISINHRKMIQIM